MHFYVNLVGFITPCYSCLPFLILALSTISFIGFWQVAEGTCFGLFLSDLWDSADIQESTAKSVAHIQAPVLRCKSTSAELKFLDKSYLWRNKRRQYFVGPWCSLPGSNIWRFYAKGQIIFKHLIFCGCDRERDAGDDSHHLLNMCHIPSSLHWFIITKLQGKCYCTHFRDEET